MPCKLPWMMAYEARGCWAEEVDIMEGEADVVPRRSCWYCDRREEALQRYNGVPVAADVCGRELCSGGWVVVRGASRLARLLLGMPLRERAFLAVCIKPIAAEI